MEKKALIGERFVTYIVPDDQMKLLRKLLNARDYRFSKEKDRVDLTYGIYRGDRLVGEVTSRLSLTELMVYNRRLEKTVEALVKPNISRELERDLEKLSISADRQIRKLNR